MPNCPVPNCPGAKLSGCQIVHFYYLGAKLSAFIILVPNCPLYYLGAKLSGARLSGAKLSYNPPLAGGQEKSSAEQMNFRDGHFIFGTSFNFQLCHPKGALVGSPFGAIYPLLWLNSISQCAIPKGDHLLVTVWCYLPTFAAKFTFLLCYPKDP